MAEVKVAIWKKKTKNNDTYLSLAIDIDGDKYSVLCFSNRKREGKNDPDFRSAKPKQEKEKEGEKERPDLLHPEEEPEEISELEPF